MHFLDYKMHPPQIWEENGGASYSPNVAYLAQWSSMSYSLKNKVITILYTDIEIHTWQNLFYIDYLLPYYPAAYQHSGVWTTGIISR